MKKIVLGIAATLMVASFASAESAGEKAAKFREGNMAVIEWNMGILGAMAKGVMPYDKQQAERAAQHILSASDLVKDGYIKDSYGKSDDKVKSIDAKRAEFDKYADKFVEEAKVLVAGAGDEAKLKAQMGAVGKTCKTCHDQFRD